MKRAEHEVDGACRYLKNIMLLSKTNGPTFAQYLHTSFPILKKMSLIPDGPMTNELTFGVHVLAMTCAMTQLIHTMAGAILLIGDMEHVTNDYMMI